MVDVYGDVECIILFGCDVDCVVGDCLDGCVVVGYEVDVFV